MKVSVAKSIESWVAEPKNTARSVLVTIFGDTILPVSERVWLSQLFKLTDVLGFSQRLIRTSMFRLAAEDWLTSERIGRQSLYSLTPLAVEESEQADRRIYHSPRPDWTGEWAVVFTDAEGIAAPVREQIVQHLRWQGFIALSGGVLASPTASPQSAAELCRRLVPESVVPIAKLEFCELQALVSAGFFAQALTIDEMAASYSSFVELYEPLAASATSLAGAQAFALRTMLVHDLRRTRLRGPDIPAELLPADWPGNAADELASSLYPKLSAQASPWLSELFEVSYPARFPSRFEAARV